EVFDDDLQALVSEEIAGQYQDRYRLVSLQASSTMNKSSSAKVELTDGERPLSGTAKGDGPVDAAFKAIKAMLKVNASLLLYSVNNITSGTDSQGEVTVRLKQDSRIVNGQGADTDIVVASAKAYIAALNKLANTELRFHPQNESLV
ncbi:MAG: 2-isopropylmalate synthase, partial [Proteobacteria bacterium]|nr:2-isopropylmalate synthase [Pseudomonadota bacterium]